MSRAQLINGQDQVNIAASGDQYQPRLVPLPDGGSVVVYRSSDGIRARMLDGTGEPQGGEVQVAGTEVLNSAYSATRLANGDIVVAYCNTTGDVIAKFYSPSMTFLSTKTILDQAVSIYDDVRSSPTEQASLLSDRSNAQTGTSISR